MNLNKLKRIYGISVLLSFLAVTSTSCDDKFFEGEGDCDVHYYVNFVYDMNLKWADAFASEVSSVNLYVFDNSGVFVKEYTGSGAELQNPGYNIELDLESGTYSFLAWCGLDNAGATEESFTVTTPVAGVTTLDEVICSLNTQAAGVYPTPTADGVYSTQRLYFLYWGYLQETLEDNHDGQSYYYTIPLIKDTNHIRIILQEITGNDMEPGDYEFSIQSANGVMNWYNQLIGNTVITYQPWDQVNDEVGVGRVDVIDGTLTYVKGVVADLSVARMLATDQNEMMLTITNSQSGDIIARVPIIQYALLSKGYYEKAYGHTMTDQEFLDREDEYVMTFFLVNGQWISSYIDIQQWRIVLQDYGLGS